MKTNDLNEEFRNLDFDIAEPEAGHRERFLKKLEQSQQKAPQRSSKIRTLWAPILGVAASLAIIFMLFGSIFNSSAKAGDLASVSPEMKQTQEFYSSLIETELNELKEEKSPETKAIIQDAMTQMKKLETEYANLKKDLLESGQDKRVIYAMITNFQQRIDLLKEVMTQIEDLKTLKKQSNENNII
ncbi:MAG: DUF4179 domain-containing protein [Salegentibacter sp.]